jgi:ATP-dependent Lhr-like helicase
VRFYPIGSELPPAPEDAPGPLAAELLDRFAGGGGYFFDDLLPTDAGLSRRQEYTEALWDLVWAGHLTCDTFAPVRALTADGTLKRPTTPKSRVRGRAMRPRFGPGAELSTRPPRPGFRSSSPTTAGRWSRVSRSRADHSRERFAGDLFARLDRYGVLTRGSVLAEDGEGGFGAAYRALTTMEESGQCRRGYFIEGLGAAQFAVPGAIDRLRDHQRDTDLENPTAVVLAAADPANAYGSALPWPEREGHRPGRKAGALVILVDGLLVLYVERGGRTLLTFTDDDRLLEPAGRALAEAVTAGRLGRVTIERANGEQIFAADRLTKLLEEAGFRMTPQGMRLRPGR